jgi:hypothetical protein
MTDEGTPGTWPLGAARRQHGGALAEQAQPGSGLRMLDGHPFPILCRCCGAKFSETIGNLKAGKAVACPRCTNSFVIPPKTLQWLRDPK